jgi:hypothetical protein
MDIFSPLFARRVPQATTMIPPSLLNIQQKVKSHAAPTVLLYFGVLPQLLRRHVRLVDQCPVSSVSMSTEQ